MAALRCAGRARNMGFLWQEVRYGLRSSARSPGFAVTVILILALGIGANTVVFSIVNTVLPKALPFDDPGRIVDLEERRENPRPQLRQASFRTLAYWREHNQVFDHIAGRVGREMHVSGLGEPLRVKATAVSSCFFSLVGVPPRLGRGFVPEEEQPGREHVMIVSHAFWRDRLGGDPQVLGKSIIVDGEDYTVIGIMPAGYRDLPSRADTAFWVPLVLDPTRAQGDRAMWAWARLKRGVSMEQARANMAVLEQQLAQADPQSYAGYDVSVERLLDRFFWSEQKSLYPLWGAVVLVLLIAGMNVAGLFLVHGNARRQEMAVRVSLGASRGRILAQLLTESLLLSLAAGSLGVLAAFWMIKGIIAVCPADVSQIDRTRIDGTVLFFTLGLSVLVGVAFGLLPAWKAGGVGPVGTLRQESSGPVTDRGWRRLCRGLVVAQIAIALTLLVGVGMLIQSLILLWKEDLGFRPKNVVVMHVEFPLSKYPEGPQAAALVKQLLQQVQTLPGVRSAAVISPYLCVGPWAGAFGDLFIEGRPPEGEEPTLTRVQIVSSDFFTTMGMRVLQGRGFTAQDMQGAKRAVIIDERLARRYFPQEDPIGRQVGAGNAEMLPVVGVASSLRDYKTLNPDVIAIYWPLSEYCWGPLVDVVVKVDEDPLRLASALRAQVAASDEDLKVSSIESLESRLAAMLAPRRFVALLLGVFAQIALALAALGLYGLLQYSVARRTHEIGIRMALGATRGRILQTVLRQGGLLVLIGAGLGLAGGYAMSQIVASLLYESRPTDPAMLAVVLVTLLVAALGACYIPARRAARVDPMVALRYE
jgi:putative ABC transport system permease protein